MSFDLTGKNALVTGATRGLGRAIADRLAELGATVYGTSRDAGGAEEIGRRYGTAPLRLELNDVESFASFAEDVTAASGGIHLLVNNAGVNIPKPAVEVTPSDWNTVLGANLTGAFFLSTAFAKHWLRTGTPAAIVNVASQAGLVAIEERAAYGASKAGLIHVTKLLALEWARAGIRVNAVAPTFVRTELTESTLSRPEWAAELLSRIPVGRFGEPREIADAVAYLLSDEAALVTGHTLAVDGGYTIR